MKQIKYSKLVKLNERKVCHLLICLSWTLDSKELLKLSGFSEYSDHWRDEKLYKVALVHSANMSEIGDDIGSTSGSCLDQWEWDDECYYEADFKCGNVDEQQDQDEARIPDIKELVLESELSLKDSSISSSAYSSKEPSITSEYQLLCRLPPSGRSSVQSLNESILTRDESSERLKLKSMP